jgi:hypothetical protein
VLVVGSEVLFWSLAALLLVAAIGLVLVAAVFGNAAVVRGQGRGYRGAELTVAVVAVIAAAGALPVVLVLQGLDPSASSPPTDLLPIVVPSLGAVGTVAGGVLAWLVAMALPARLVRRPGLRPRRHRYRVWSDVVIVAAVGATVWAFLAETLSTAIRVVLMGSIAAVGLRRLERRFGAQLPAVPPGLHGHVLYLRPFRTETRALFRLPLRDAEATGNGVRSLVPLDEFLVRGTGERLGDVVALGNPTEFLPPGGALRVYLSDDDWQGELAGLADRAALIVMQPGRTRAMRWELEHIAGHGLRGRFFVLTPPRYRGSGAWARLRVATDRLNGWDPPTWPEFARELAAAGLPVRCADPGPGAVVGFGDDGAAVVVARDLRAPADFADAMLRHAG